MTWYFHGRISYWYVWLSKIFGEELGVVVDKVFGCRTARLHGERVQLLHRKREIEMMPTCCSILFN